MGVTAEDACTGRHAIVTGGTGYIGGALVRFLANVGCSVTVLCRSPAAPRPGVRYMPWRMGEPVPDSAWTWDGGRAADWLFHFAHDWTGDTDVPEDSVNFRGARLIVDDARRHGTCRLLFASSQSARPGTASRYGRVKLAVERLLQGPDEIAVRIGLVYGGGWGGGWGGAVGGLLRMVRRLPAAPVPGGAPSIRPAHVDDVCAALCAIARDGWRDGGQPFLAADETMTLAAFLGAVGTDRLGARIRTIPLPPRVFSAAGSLVPSGLAPSLRDRLVGLGELHDRTPSLPEGIRFRTLREGLAPDRIRTERRRRQFEAKAVASLLVGRAPALALRKAYVRTVGAESPLVLPGRFGRARAFLGRAEIAGRRDDVAERIALALALAETDRSARALMVGRPAGPGRWAGLLRDLAADALFGAWAARRQ